MKYILLLIFLFPALAYSYPNFIGYGYQSCLTCHYNPLGNGPLTDYGRGLGATVISDRIFSSKETTDDYIGKNSGFLYSTPINSWLRPSATYRNLYLKSDVGTNSEDSQIIHMQANFNLVLRLGPQENKDKFFMTITAGYSPKPKAHPESDEPLWRTREHYIGYRPIESLGFYLGLMDKAFGIRIPDHIAFSRVSTSNTMNDQTHGVMIHYNHELFEVALQSFVGNLEQEESTRQKGNTVRAEYSFNKKTRLGVSYQASKSDFLKSTSISLHSKMQFGKGSSTMIELGKTTRDNIIKSKTNNSRYVMMQNHLRLRRGLHALVTGEYFKQNTLKENKVIRLGPGIQFFPFRSLELRLDLYNSRIFSETTVSDDRWDLTGQVHLWF